MAKRFILVAGFLLASGLGMAQTNRHNNLGNEAHLWKLKRVGNTAFIGVGNDGTVMKYSTTCNDWLPVNFGNNGEDFRNISFPTMLVGYISGTGNGLYKTADGGGSWTYINPAATGLTNGSIQAVYFLNTDTGFIAGSQIGVSGGGRFIKRTVNGGSTWTNVTPADISTSTVYDFGFFNSMDGIAVATNNKAFKTSDGGLTWTSVTTPGMAYSVAVIDGQKAIAVANSAVFRTTDKGNTWTSVITGASGLQGVHFYDNAHGMMTGASGTLLYSSDTGITWAPVTTLASGKLYDVVMTDTGKAVVVGAGGWVMDVDKDQNYHRLFDERFCHPADSVSYYGYSNTDLTNASYNRKWFFQNVNEEENGLTASGWFPGNFAIYDAAYYENVLSQHASDSAYIETRALDFSGTNTLSLEWLEAFYTHPDFLSKTRIEGYNGSSWIPLYENAGLNDGDGVAAAVFPDGKRSVDISVLAGVSNAKLRFYYIAPNTADELKHYWAIGNITVNTKTTDVAVDSLTAIGMGNGCLPNEPLDISIHLHNPGQQSLFPLAFQWQSSDGQSGYGAAYDSIVPGNTFTSTLIIGYMPPAGGGTVTFKAWINNCPNHDYSNDTTQLQLTFLPAPGNVSVGFLGADTTVCPNTEIVLHTPAGASNIIWSTGASTDSVSVSAPGGVYVSGVINGCTVTDSLEIYHFDVTVPQIQEANGILTVSPAGYAGYHWYWNGESIDTVSGSSLSQPVSGDYQVRVVTADGCDTVSAVYSYGATSAENIASDNRIRVYPIPVSGNYLNIDFTVPQAGNYVLTLYDAFGREIKKLSLSKLTTHYQLDVSQLVPGMYVIKITGTQHNYETRFTRL